MEHSDGSERVAIIDESTTAQNGDVGCSCEQQP
jgi:hypothetical protein